MTEIKILNLTITQLRDEGYQTQYRRGFTATIDDKTVNQIMNEIDMAGTVNSDDINISNVMSISNNTVGIANIEDEWDTNRYSFTLSVYISESTFSGNAKYKMVYSGYTSAVNGLPYRTLPSGRTIIDDNLVFYINNVHKYELGSKANVINYSAFGIANTTSNRSYNSFNSERVVGLRPIDIISNLRTNHMESNRNGIRVIDTGDFIDGFTTFNRKNQVGRWFTNNIINNVVTNSVKDNILNSTNVWGDERGDILSKSVLTSKEYDLVNDPFIYKLTELQGRDLIYSNDIHYFNFHELQKIDSTFDEEARDNNGRNRVIIQNITKDTGINFIDINSHDMDNGLLNSRVGLAMLEATTNIVEFLHENILSNISFTINNYDDINEPVYEVAEINTSGGLSVSQQMLNKIQISFRNYIKQNIHRLLSFNNECCYDAFFIVNTSSEANISYSIEGGDIQHLRVPVFADTKFTPLVGGQNNRDRITETFRVITDNIMDYYINNNADLYTDIY